MGEGTPYREMPLPSVPPRAWRPIVERCLAMFNALVLVALVLYRMMLPPGYQDIGVSASPVFLGVFPSLALLGFVVPMPRVLRACLILPSAGIWFLLGATGALMPLMVHRVSDSPHASRTFASAGVAAFGLLFVAVGLLSIESSTSRMRTPRRRPASR